MIERIKRLYREEQVYIYVTLFVIIICNMYILFYFWNKLIIISYQITQFGTTSRTSDSRHLIDMHSKNIRYEQVIQTHIHTLHTP